MRCINRRWAAVYLGIVVSVGVATVQVRKKIALQPTTPKPRKRS